MSWHRSQKSLTLEISKCPSYIGLLFLRFLELCSQMKWIDQTSFMNSHKFGAQNEHFCKALHRVRDKLMQKSTYFFFFVSLSQTLEYLEYKHWQWYISKPFKVLKSLRNFYTSFSLVKSQLISNNKWAILKPKIVPKIFLTFLHQNSKSVCILVRPISFKLQWCCMLCGP